MKAKMIVLFADWCSICNMMMPIVDEVQNHYGERLQVIQIDVTEDWEIAESYGAQLVPTFILYKDDCEVGRMVGMIGEKTFYQRIDRLFF